MTDQQPMDSTPPPMGGSLADEPLADEPLGEQRADAGDPGSEGAAGGARAREWMTQLETMIQEIATQAAPVARQVGAKAAELAAVAATKAGPIAQRAAEVTTEYGQKFADRASAVAAELRSDAEGNPDATAGGTPAPDEPPGQAPTAPPPETDGHTGAAPPA